MLMTSSAKKNRILWLISNYYKQNGPNVFFYILVLVYEIELLVSLITGGKSNVVS